MEKKMTAKQVVDSIRNQIGAAWQYSPADVFQAGNPGTIVTGIITSYTPSIEVLKKSLSANKNLIITQQPVFYQETESYLKNDPTFIYKKELIEQNKLVIWRFYDNWNSRQINGQLFGLARALGWDKYHMSDPKTGSLSFDRANHFFNLPEGNLREKTTEIKDRLKIQGLRVIGNPETKIRKVSISNGLFTLAELQLILNEADIDLIVIAEAIEWESCEYFRDYLSWKGSDKAMILLGREASEDPGYKELADWLKTIIPELPVEWISAEEPFWVP